MVGDPGIEPGVGLPGGVTVRCRTLQLVARRWAGNIEGAGGRQGLSHQEIARLGVLMQGRILGRMKGGGLRQAPRQRREGKTRGWP